LSDEDWAWYTTTADEIAEGHPVEAKDFKDGDFAAWAQQSYDLSVNDVYPGKSAFSIRVLFFSILIDKFLCQVSSKVKSQTRTTKPKPRRILRTT
jgi:hypothetical protein